MIEASPVTDPGRIPGQSPGPYAGVSPLNDRGIPRLRSAWSPCGNAGDEGADDGGGARLNDC